MRSAGTPVRTTRSRKSLALGFLLALMGGALWFLGLFGPKGTEVGDELVPYSTLSHPSLREVSGLVVGSRFPEVLWVHNDSGNEPRLFAISLGGQEVMPEGFEVEAYPGIEVKGAELVDWESIARNGDKLYICDMGNNLNARRHLGVYEVKEPNPYTDTEAEVLKYFEVTYPDQTSFPPTDEWKFDSEASFCWDDKLYILTKERPAFRLFIQKGSTTCYSLNLNQTGALNRLTLEDRLDSLGGWVTAADIDSEGRRIALLCESPQQSIWLFERSDESSNLLSGARKVSRYLFHGGGQLESLAFAKTTQGEELFMVNEEREVFRVPMSKFEVVNGANP